MKVPKELIEEIKSSDGHLYKLHIPKTKEGKDRKNEVIQVLKELECENIIHVGACGHLKGIQRQLEKGTWFHAKLCSNFKNVIGTDINGQAIEYLVNQGKKRLYNKDVIIDSEMLKNEIERKKAEGSKNAILLPEVLEHIEEPYIFLRNLKENYKGYYIVITVPNAFGTWVFFDILRHNYERINSDHKYWFTPFTLLKIAILSGVEIEELRFCDYSITGKILKKPIIANTLLLIGRLGQE